MKRLIATIPQLFIGAAAFLVSASSVLAGYGLSEAATPAGLQSTSIQVRLGEILRYALGFTGTIFFLLIVWAGLLWMTAAGNEEQTKKAMGILKGAVIGLIIVIAAYAITRFIGQVIL